MFSLLEFLLNIKLCSESKCEHKNFFTNLQNYFRSITLYMFFYPFESLSSGHLASQRMHLISVYDYELIFGNNTFKLWNNFPYLAFDVNKSFYQTFIWCNHTNFMWNRIPHRRSTNEIWGFVGVTITWLIWCMAKMSKFNWFAKNLIMTRKSSIYWAAKIIFWNSIMFCVF